MRQTHEEFMKDAADRGSYREAVAVAAAALFKVYSRADLNNRQNMVSDICHEAIKYGCDVKGWEESAETMARDLVRSINLAT